MLSDLPGSCIRSRPEPSPWWSGVTGETTGIPGVATSPAYCCSPFRVKAGPQPQHSGLPPWTKSNSSRSLAQAYALDNPWVVARNESGPRYSRKARYGGPFDLSGVPRAVVGRTEGYSTLVRRSAGPATLARGRLLRFATPCRQLLIGAILVANLRGLGLSNSSPFLLSRGRRRASSCCPSTRPTGC
jgi:hypothetical protein